MIAPACAPKLALSAEAKKELVSIVAEFGINIKTAIRGFRAWVDRHSEELPESFRELCKSKKLVAKHIASMILKFPALYQMHIKAQTLILGIEEGQIDEKDFE